MSVCPAKTQISLGICLAIDFVYKWRLEHFTYMHKSIQNDYSALISVPYDKIRGPIRMIYFNEELDISDIFSGEKLSFIG